jgi:hypothetical protein
MNLKDWKCLSCDRTGLYPEYKFICFCHNKQLVCTDCYKEHPEFTWVKAFGPEHHVKNKDGTPASYSMNEFKAFVEGGAVPAAFAPPVQMTPNFRVIATTRSRSVGEVVPVPPRKQEKKQEPKSTTSPQV